MQWPTISNQVFDGAQVSIAPQTRKVIDVRGNPVTRPTGNTRLRSEAGPNVELPTGRIVLCDPSALNESDVRPLATTVPPGSYPTQFLFADAPLDGRVAFAALWIKPETPSMVAPAPRINEVNDRLSPGESFGIGTDSASLCFADMQVCERLARADDEETRLWTRADEAWNGKSSIAPLNIPGIGVALMFSSGFGDGLYSYAWGLDRARSPVCLVVDLDVVQTDLIASAYARKKPWCRFR